MEFWKRKKGQTSGSGSPPPPAPNAVPHNINITTISGPIHNMEASIPSSRNAMAPNDVAPSPTSDFSSVGDAEFRERYRAYMQHRRQSHSSQTRPTITADTTEPSVTTRQPVPINSFERRAPSVASSVGSAGNNEDARISSASGGGPPRGSLRSTRSTATSTGTNNPQSIATAAVRHPPANSSANEMALRDSSLPRNNSKTTSTNTVPARFPSSASSMSVASVSSSNAGSTNNRRSGMVMMGASSNDGLEQLDDEEINILLGRLMDEMDLKGVQRVQMQRMSTPNKIRLLKQHQQLESFHMDSKGNSPEYFYQHLTETDIRSLPKQMLVHLRVCVSTQPVNWVKQFVEIQGLEALSDGLGILNHAGVRKGDDITKEMEIIKCIKSLVNIRWGAQDVLRYPACVHNLCFSIDAPSLLTRRLISEILTYISYLNVPTGHATVMKGLDKLQKFREMQKRFEPWMRALESAVDGRGRMGSKVGASEELRQLGGTADRDLTDYVLSSMIFINAVVGVSDDVEMRIHYRNQLNAAGLGRIIKKLRGDGLDSPLIALQVNKYDKDSEQDNADVLELYNQQIMQDMTDPEEVFQAILAQIDDDDRARDHFLSILQRLLLLRDDFIGNSDSASVNSGNMVVAGSRATNKSRYYQLLDEITTQVVMDIRNGDSLGSEEDDEYFDDDDQPNMGGGARSGRHLGTRTNDAFTAQYGVSVAGIIDKFSNEEQLEEAVREAKDLRDQLEKVTRQKNELELEVSLKSEGLVGTLKTKIFALEDLLRMSRHTIEALQTQIKELRDQFTQKLAKQDSQLKQLYSALQDEASEHDMLRRLKDDLTLENEVLKSGVALEPSEDDPDHVMLNPELLLAEIEKLKKQRPDLNRMTEARKMLEKILADANSGKPQPATKEDGEEKKEDEEEELPVGAKMGMVTMESVPSAGPTRLAELASEIEKKLGHGGPAKIVEVDDKSGDEETIPGAGEKEEAEAEGGSKQTGEKKDVATEQPADSTPAPPAPPAPLAPPAPSAPPAPPPPPPASASTTKQAGSGGLAPPSVAALVAVKLKSTKKRDEDGDDDGEDSGPPSAPPAPPPPPPPPTLSAATGAGVPAPPPPPAPNFLDGALRRKELVYVPKVKLKALQWEKLNDQSVDSSLWSKLEEKAGLEERDVIDTLHHKGTFTQLERMFAAKQAVDIFALREKRRKEREAKQQDEISVLDSKRAYNISIMLGMLKKLSFSDIRRALLKMDTEVITENTLKQLLTFVPTPEERGLLTAYQGRADRKRLARPERFFLETMKVWRYEQRLRVTTTWVTWPESFRDLQADVAAVMTASHAVSTSRHFPQVLEVVLSIGNYMNGAGFRGGAFGFRIASLNRMMDTKAEDNKTTLLHFVTSTVEESFPDALAFLEELHPVDSGCRVSYAEMRAELADMRVRLSEAKRELELLREQREKELKEIAMDDGKKDVGKKPQDDSNSVLSSSEDEEEMEGVRAATTSASNSQDWFLLKIRKFVMEATEQYEAISSQFTSMNEAYSNSVLLYGEDPHTMTPEEFFGIFKTFTASFSQCVTDNVRERERKRTAEKRRKQIEVQIEQKRMAKQNRANRLATGASRIRDQLNSPESTQPSSPSQPTITATMAEGDGKEVNEENNGAVDDLLKSLMAGTDLERVEATKRRRRRELMSIRRRSSVRRSIHRTSISAKALQMLRDIKEDDDVEDEDGPPPLPTNNPGVVRRRSVLLRNPREAAAAVAERMSIIEEDSGNGLEQLQQRRSASTTTRRRQL